MREHYLGREEYLATTQNSMLITKTAFGRFLCYRVTRNTPKVNVPSQKRLHA